MAKRITKTWRIVRILYSLPKDDYIIRDDVWRRTNFKRRDVHNYLQWLKRRKLVEAITELIHRENYAGRRNRYRLSKDGRIYAKRRIEREKFEGVNNVA